MKKFKKNCPIIGESLFFVLNEFINFSQYIGIFAKFSCIFENRDVQKKS